MKKFLVFAQSALLVALLATALFPRRAAYNPITPERKATHMITYLNDDGEEIGFCTGTAVGPHALLTAVHCDEGKSTTITIDLSTKRYQIIGFVTDGRDHIVYRLDGPEFTQTIDLREREAVLGERVISYGTGGRDFPQHTYTGGVVQDLNGGDTSDVDRAVGTHRFSLPVVPGDSGSAVYGRDGSVVALVTYGGENAAVGFALAFTPNELQEIKQ